MITHTVSLGPGTSLRSSSAELNVVYCTHTRTILSTAHLNTEHPFVRSLSLFSSLYANWENAFSRYISLCSLLDRLHSWASDFTTNADKYN